MGQVQQEGALAVLALLPLLADSQSRPQFSVEKDFAPRVAKKSLFHCFRLLNFATQIARGGRIVDYEYAARAGHRFFSVNCVHTHLHCVLFAQIVQRNVACDYGRRFDRVGAL